MTIGIHRSDVQEANRTQEKAQATLRQKTEFASLLHSLSESNPVRPGKAVAHLEWGGESRFSPAIPLHRGNISGKSGDVTGLESKAVTKGERIQNAVQNAASENDIDPNLVYAVIKQESGFKESAQSHCGAQGLMQLMPGTARNLGVTNSYDIEQNIDGGVKYLRQMLDQFGGNTKMAVAAYNAGPGAVQKYGGIPPYDETENYVKSVMAHYQSFTGGAPLPDFMNSDLGSLMRNLDRRILAQAAIANSIASTPMDLPMPERRPSEDEPPPPPPPPTAVRV